MDVEKLLNKTFPPHTRLVWALAEEIDRLQKELDTLTELHRRFLNGKRLPVAVVVENDGEFRVYGDGVDVRVVNLPRGDFQGDWRTAAEAWVESKLPKRFSALLLPRFLTASGSPKGCRDVPTLYKAHIDRELFEVIAEWERTSKSSATAGASPTKTDTF